MAASFGGLGEVNVDGASKEEERVNEGVERSLEGSCSESDCAGGII